MPLVPLDRTKLDKIFARGLCAGVSDGDRLCVMAALAAACGEPVNDVAASACVLPAARKFAIALNDCEWSSPAARSAGLRDLALALPGTATLDAAEFAGRLALLTIKRVLPIALRAAGLESHATACKRSGDLAAATRAAARAGAAATRAEVKARGAAVAAATRAVATRAAATRAAARDAAAAAAYAASRAAARDAVQSAVATAAEVASSSAAAARVAARDRVLAIAAQCCVEAMMN